MLMQARVGQRRRSLPPAVTTWDPADAPSGMTLSNGNRTATNTHGSAILYNVMSTTSHLTGKYYFEVTYNGANAGGGGGPDIGFVPPGFPNNTYSTNNGGLAFETYGEIRGYDNTVLTSTFDKWNGASVLGVGVDLGTARAAWGKVVSGAQGTPNGYWNGSSSANPATGVGGLTLGANLGVGIAAFLACCPDFVGDAFTLNTGQTPFVGAVPAGFQQWG